MKNTNNTYKNINSNISNNLYSSNSSKVTTNTTKAYNSNR